MRIMFVFSALILSACSVSPDAELQAHLEAERDFAIQQYHMLPLEEQYDPEYIDDCLYYEELVCEELGE